MTGGGWPHTGHSGPGVAGVRNILLDLELELDQLTSPSTGLLSCLLSTDE